MRRLLTDYRVFLGEFRRSFHTTGAILPSGRSLGRALARFVREGRGPRRILEVGPGTGAVTAWIIRGMNALDRLDLCELNERFVNRLGDRLETEPLFQSVAQRTTILFRPAEHIVGENMYDVIVSGLPLNNFSVDHVDKVLATFDRLLVRPDDDRPGGTLSFFEYVAVRPLRGLVSSRSERARLRGVGAAIGRIRHGREIRRELVWPNVPPAWVHHVRADGS
jgi:phospholipid N-methyltransferase